ncbi:hypothetical protein QUA35_22570 [Microcoleus sp. N9_B2]|uniref:hypothetical protein n=1 Tax=unclassified Microcoleus TaxID=2642155 RepID=UPI002FD49171
MFFPIHLSYKFLLPFSLIWVFFVGLLDIFKYAAADWLNTLYDRFFFISIQAIIIFTVFYALMWLCRIDSLLFTRPIQISPQDIQRVKLSGIHLPLLKKSITFCLIRTKSRNYCFGLFLPQAEKEWLVGELSDCLSLSK